MRNFMGISIVVLGVTIFGSSFRVVVTWAQSSVKCQPGQTPVEEFSTGKVRCEGEDSLDTSTLRHMQRKLVAPASPGVPGRPDTPQRPRQSGIDALEGSKSCGFSRWGCQEVCQSIYLASATSTTTKASHRARVAHGTCLRVCREKFACEPKPPKVRR